jgi:hypothetical protein
VFAQDRSQSEKLGLQDSLSAVTDKGPINWPQLSLSRLLLQNHHKVHRSENPTEPDRTRPAELAKAFQDCL